MGDFNPGANALLGSEVRPQSVRYVVLSQTNRAVIMRFRPGVGTLVDIGEYLQQFNGTPGIAAEVVSTLQPTLDAPVDIFPGTDTGATETDWQNESAAAASYTKVAKKLAGSTYLTPNTSKATSLRFRGTTAIAGGKRVMSLTHSMLVQWPGAAAGGISGFFYNKGGGTAYPPLKGVLNISSADWPSGLAAPAPGGTYQTWSSLPMMLNPATGIPWTLNQANALCNGTDTFGITRDQSVYSLEAQVGGLWLTAQTCAENRVAHYYSSTATAKGWQRGATLSGPNGATIAAFAANTWYYLVIYLLNTAGGASVVVPVLKDANVVAAASASSSTGEHRQLSEAVLTSGVVTSVQTKPGELMPALIMTATGTDTFDRANNAASAGSADTGQAYTAAVGTWGINGNELYRPTSGGAYDQLTQPSGADGFVEWTYGSNVQDGMGCLLRWVDSANFLHVERAAGFGVVNLYQRVAGVSTFVDNAPMNNAIGDVVRVVFIGTNLAFYSNGVLTKVIPGVTQFATTGTRVGLQCPAAVTNAARWNGFKWGAFNSQSQPYVAVSSTPIGTGPAQQITAPAGLTYLGVRATIGWATSGQQPNAPLTIEIRHGGGAATGGGTLDATATIPANALSSYALTDITALFSASFVSSAIAYYVFFRSASTNPWAVALLDTDSATQSGLAAAIIEAQGIGGTTDGYYDTSGTLNTRYDLACLLLPSVGAPSAPTATVLAGA